MRLNGKNKGKIITFYSYKGGTGRSMSLANVACLLSRETEGKILLMDWDLEAPGLHEYFTDYLPKGIHKSKGLIDFFLAAEKALPAMPQDEEDDELLEHFFARLEEYTIKLKQIPSFLDNLYLIPSGSFDENYNDRISQFNWQRFFQKIPAFFTLFAHYLRKHYSYVLIDSRTGHTDTGGICTMLMPEKLVLVFTPNRQSLKGVLQLAEKATKYRRNSDDLRPLSIYPLPSRVELDEMELRKKWQKQYENDFVRLFQKIYDLPGKINLSAYFEQVQIRHVPKYSYGEEVAVIKESTRDINSLALAYEAFTAYLTSDREIWRYIDLRQLIAEDNVQRAVETMRDYYPHSDELVALSGRLNAIQNQFRTGILSDEIYVQTLNQIRSAAIELIEKLTELEEVAEPQKVRRQLKN